MHLRRMLLISFQFACASLIAVVLSGNERADATDEKCRSGEIKISGGIQSQVGNLGAGMRTKAYYLDITILCAAYALVRRG